MAPPRLRLVEALLAEDRAEEAARLLEPLTAAADGPTLAALAAMHQAQGRSAEAAACARAALGSPGLPTRTLLAAAATLARAHDPEAADAALAAAIEAGDPDLALRIARARLAEERGRSDLAILHWQRVLNLGPDQLEAKLGLARALRGEARYAEAESLCRLLRAAAPTDARPLAELARAAHDAGDPVEAERRWHDALLAVPAQPMALAGLAQALTAQHRFAEARALLEALGRREPERPEHRAALVRCLLAEGDLAAADRLALALADRPGASLEHRLLLGRVREALPDGSGATTLYRALCDQLPEAPGCQLALAEWLAHQGDFAGARGRYQRCLALAPGQLAATVGLAAALAELGLAAEAEEAAAAAARQAPSRPQALLARARVAEILGQLAAARVALLEVRSALPWRAEPLLQLAQFSLRHGDHAAADAHGRALLDAHPGQLAARLAACDGALAVGDHSRARAILDGLAGDLPAHREVQRRLARFDWLEGAIPRARARWARITRHDPRIHGDPGPIARLDGHPLPEPAGEVRAFLLVRNERIRLPWLLDHYRALGVDRFLILDNASDDGTADWLLAQGPDVHLFQTSASFAASGAGMRWTNALLDRHGCGAWCLTVDADEALVYPHSEKVRLPELTAHLDRCGAEAMLAPMLDLYADRPLAEIAYTPGDNLLEAFPWFDAEPLLRRDSNDFPFVRLQGGSRARAFHAHAAAGPVLQKVPLIRWRPDIKYTSSKHTAFPCRLAEVTGALLHFKYLPAFAAQVGAEVARGQHYLGGKEYRAYQRRLAREAGLSLLAGISRRYRGSDQLVELGFMHSSPAYEAHVRGRAQA